MIGSEALVQLSNVNLYSAIFFS